MPVADHAVHPSTQKGLDFRYGCWNRPEFADGYWAHPWNRQTSKWVLYRMSRECQYDMSDTDWMCEGCKRRKV